MKPFHHHYHPGQGSRKNWNGKKPGGIFKILLSGLLISILPGAFLLAQEWARGEDYLYVYPTSTLVGIGVEHPETELDVNGTLQTSGFRLVDQEQEFVPGYVLTSDGSGNGTWQPIPFRWVKSGNDIYYNSGNVGIGTTAPASRLSVAGEIDISGSRLHVGTDGKVGINNNAPLARFEVNANTGDGDIASFSHPGSLVSGDETKITIGAAEIQSWYSEISTESWAAGKLILNPAGGNVGIGTASPGNYKLAVNGTIRSKEIVVETGWSDFVFEDDYRLPPLSEVEQHIQQHKHLPGIPSAKEVEANGVSLGEMQAKLLQKIEELTLYVIELKKENEGLRERMKDLENRK